MESKLDRIIHITINDFISINLSLKDALLFGHFRNLFSLTEKGEPILDDMHFEITDEAICMHAPHKNAMVNVLKTIPSISTREIIKEFICKEYLDQPLELHAIEMLKIKVTDFTLYMKFIEMIKSKLSYKLCRSILQMIPPDYKFKSLPSPIRKISKYNHKVGILTWSCNVCFYDVVTGDKCCESIGFDDAPIFTKSGKYCISYYGQDATPVYSVKDCETGETITRWNWREANGVWIDETVTPVVFYYVDFHELSKETFIGKGKRGDHTVLLENIPRGKHMLLKNCTILASIIRGRLTITDIASKKTLISVYLGSGQLTSYHHSMDEEIIIIETLLPTKYQIISLLTGEKLHTEFTTYLASLHTSGTHSIRLSHDGKMIALITDKYIDVYSIATQHVINRFDNFLRPSEFRDGDVYIFECGNIFLRDNKSILIVSKCRSEFTINCIETGKVLHTCKCTRGVIKSVFC